MVVPNPRTRGVADSVLGGEPQVFHPPPGTVRAFGEGENETVWLPLVIDGTAVKFDGVIERTVVPLVYPAVGVAIVAKLREGRCDSCQ